MDDVIVAWRCWEVKYDAALLRTRQGWSRVGRPGLRLFSWTRQDSWPTLAAFDALAGSPACIAAGHPKLRSLPNCQCGLHAFKSKLMCLDHLKDEFQRRDKDTLIAFGRVSLWGKYVEAAGGWRARYGYPYDVKLLNCNDPALARDLANAYAIDVTYGPWDYTVETGDEDWDCVSNGHYWEQTTLTCVACGVTREAYELAVLNNVVSNFDPAVQNALGPVPQFFSAANDAVTWFQEQASTINGLMRDGIIDAATTQTVIISLRDAIRPWAHRDSLTHHYTTTSLSVAGAYSRAAVTFSNNTALRRPPQ